MAFVHPFSGNILVYIGGEMPHWMKKFVNALENSGLDSEKRSMEFRGKKISLHMLEKVLRVYEGEINKLRMTRLTNEHFHKNAHSCMRVHLAVQVLSMSVLNMLKAYCNDNIEKLQEYEQLMMIDEKMNTVVDIWNHSSSKTFKCESN